MTEGPGARHGRLERCEIGPWDLPHLSYTRHQKNASHMAEWTQPIPIARLRTVPINLKVPATLLNESQTVSIPKSAIKFLVLIEL